MKNDCIDAHFYLLLTIKHMKNMNNEKFEKLDNEQKELVRYWIDKLVIESKSSVASVEARSFTEKHLTPDPVIEVGKAYKYPDADGWMLFVSKIDSDGFVHGYGFDTNCLWMDQWEQKHKRELENVVECTEQFKERLVEEAERKAYKSGMKLLSPRTGDLHTTKNCWTPNFLHASDGFHFYYMDACVMSNGKWADVIDEKAEIRQSVARLEAELKELKSKL